MFKTVVFCYQAQKLYLIKLGNEEGLTLTQTYKSLCYNILQKLLNSR